MNNNTPPNNKGNGNNNGGKAPKNTQNMLMFAVFVIAAILVWALFNNQYTQATSQEITYDKFLDMLEADEVASVEDTGSTWKITPKKKDKDGVTLTYYTGKMANDTELLPLMREKNVEIQPYIQNDAMISIALNILSIVVPMILLWVLFSGFMRRMGGGGGVMGVGKSKA